MLIAHDVEPVELVVWLPALCRKMGVPYAIVKGKARLGSVVHYKTATVLALTAVKPEDKHELSKIVESVKQTFNDRFDENKKAVSDAGDRGGGERGRTKGRVGGGALDVRRRSRSRPKMAA